MRRDDMTDPDDGDLTKGPDAASGGRTLQGDDAAPGRADAAGADEATDPGAVDAGSGAGNADAESGPGTRDAGADSGAGSEEAEGSDASGEGEPAGSARDDETIGGLGLGEDGASDAAPATDAPRVLIIDDEAPVANFLAEALRAHGLEPVVASDGAAGLQAFHECRPDLVFCDLLIPKRNGFQLLHDFRRLAPDVPVVVMSGIYRQEKYSDELSHARLFLSKPLDLVHVQEALGLLEQRLAERAAAPELAEQPASTAPAPAPSREPWLPLSVLPLPRLLHLLASDRRTGLLTLRAKERQTVFMIDGGRLQFVRTNDPDLRLDRVLLQLGRVTAVQLEAAQAELAIRHVPTRLGEVLVEQEALAPAELDRAIQVQLRRIVASAFSEADGETLFRAESIAAGEDVVIDSDLRTVIVAGCLSVRDDGERLIGHLPDGACRVELPADGLDASLKLPVTVARLLEAIDEPMRLADLVALADLVGLRGRWVVFGLLCADALALHDEKPAWQGRVARPETAERLSGPPLEIVLGLERDQATGILRARWQGVTAWMALREGRLVQAASSDARTRIGGLLRAAGLVTPEQVEGALREQASRPGRPLGHVLVEMGLLSAPALRTAVPAQVAWVAREMLARACWDEATFHAGETPDREPVEIDSSVSELAVQALREMDEPSLRRLVDALAPLRPTLDLDALRDGRLGLTESEEMVTDALATDTEHLLQAMAAADPVDVEVLRVVAMALVATPPEETPADDAVQVELETAG